MRLLLLEDDEVLGEALTEFLRAEGHAVDWCRSVAEARVLHDQPQDVWLVDWQLPDGSGLDWLRARRARGDTTPALILTAKDRLAERVQGLDGGADDYLVKPVAPEELAARLRAMGRRMAGGDDLRSFGDVCVQLAARRVERGGVEVRLTAREWTLLEALVRRPGRIVPKADLERLAWGSDTDMVSNTLEVHMSALRRKLRPDLIETVRGLGYRLQAPQ